jgi:two-component system chemotaxis sensor kinase CheA
MDINQKRFVEDALDLLNELDEGLMQLEANPLATAPLEQVFRTMHTIKGGANMFGFENIGALAHQLETIYDLVRSGKLQVSDRLISITLHAFDKVRDLLKEKDGEKIARAESLKDHLQVAAEFLSNVEAGMSDLEDGDDQLVAKDALATYLIRIVPNISITPDGNHPLIFIIKDLELLGTARTFCYKQADNVVLHWDLFLSFTGQQTEIESYFIFAEDECEVSYNKLSTVDLFGSEDFIQLLDRLEDRPAEISAMQLAAIAVSEKLSRTYFQQPDPDDSDRSVRKKKGLDSYIKVSKHKIDDLLNGISELIILQAQLTTSIKASNFSRLTEITEHLDMITTRLRDTSLEIGLVPIETLVTKFKRLVRDLSKSLNKKVNFISEGAETEMDKDVIEIMSEPIMHIIRNAIDHGIETPEERKTSGKPEHGTVKLKAFNTSAYVNIHISDDGRGISKEKVLQKAIEKGLIDSNSVLAQDEILQFVFHPGLSTASTVSDISGRGVGMDVVKQKIHDLRGYVSLSSSPGTGTSIEIKLPLSRSIIEGLLVNVAGTRYVIPLNSIERIDRLPYSAMETDGRVYKNIIVNEEPMPIFCLRRKFHSNSLAPKTSDIISVNINGIRKGIAVDNIEGKMQTVLKPLGELYQHQDFISGSTILGNGTLALVLDPSRLFETIEN